MKQNMRFSFILSLVFAFALGSFGQQQGSQPVELKKISDRLYEITGGRGANGGAYIGDNAVLIIDAKMDAESVEQVGRAVAGITDKPIRYLVNTHSDGDHIRGNRYFPATVTIIAHENCRQDFLRPGRNGAPSEWNKPELAAFVPSVTFQEKMAVHLGSRKVELWYFGIGHTTGDIVVCFPEEKTAFLGDQFFVGRPQLIHSHKGGNSFEHVRTLEKMLKTLDAEAFCSGHAEKTDRKAIENHIAQMKRRQETVRTLAAQDQSLEQIKNAFSTEEERLITVIYDEVNKGRQ